MKLGLLGYPIEHSLSPELYKNFLGSQLESYELFSFKEDKDIPTLEYFSGKLDGLNITSPYKRHFLNEVIIPSPQVQQLGAINTLAFSNNGTFATNTDMLAVVEILKNYCEKYGSLQIFLLGDGVMAALTKIIALDLNIPIRQFSRKNSPDFFNLDFRYYEDPNAQSLIINACSRDFVFNGMLTGKEIFWDFNYSFAPHESLLPDKLFSYQDGREMLELQAKAAIKFWESYI
ncbi:MAG: hypothetical protein ACLGHN_05375 [Bacteriovoracia bacterium]